MRKKQKKVIDNEKNDTGDTGKATRQEENDE